jgi:hypothetical protein
MNLMADRLSLLGSDEPLEDSEAGRRQMFSYKSSCEPQLLGYLLPEW